MPITNYKQLARFSEGCGAEIPRWIVARLEGYGEDLDAIRAFGLDVTLRLCETLLERGAPGLHFYTLNRTEPDTCHLAAARPMSGARPAVLGAASDRRRRTPAGNCNRR